jgi:transcription elongation factor GreA
MLKFIDVKDIPETGRVVFGATIDLYDVTNDKSITYKIVGNLESNPEAGLISIQTPIAMGLMGKNVGDEVSISTPSGTIDLEIEKVQHL